MDVRSTGYLALAIVAAGLAGCCSTKSNRQGCSCGAACGCQSPQSSCYAPAAGCMSTCVPDTTMAPPQPIQLPLESVPSGKSYEEETPPPPVVEGASQRQYVTPMNLQAPQPGELRPAAVR